MPWWRVEAGPYWDMPESERDRLIAAYARWLSGLRGKAWIHGVVEEDSIKWEDLEATYRAPRFYVEAPHEDDPALAGLPAERSLPLERPRPVGTYRGGLLLLEGGVFARCYAVTSLPPQLPEAAFAEYDVIDEVHMLVEPYGALGRLRAKHSRLQAFAVGGFASIWEAMGLLLQEASAGYRLLRLRIILVVRGGSPEEARARARRLETLLDSLGARYSSPYLGRAQKALYNLSAVERWRGILVSSGAAPALYPFISEELAHPGGIFLGLNLRTGSPIVYNPYRMPNYNLVVLGETGSGKSMTGKVYIRRWWRRFQGLVYVIDPSGEYARVADRLAPGLRAYRVSPEAGGLDPVRLYRAGHLSLSSLVDILTDAYRLSREERLSLIDRLETAESMEDLLDIVREARIDAGLFRGAPVEPGEHGAVYDLSELRSKREKTLAGSIIAAVLARRLRGKSLLVVDEGWMWADYPALMSLLAETSRVGRKYGVNFLFLTQRPADVLNNPAGRTILEQSATVLLLRLNEASIEAIREVYRLTESEEQRLIEARPGEGVLRAGSWRLSIYVQPSRTELRLFSTRPEIE